MPNTHPLVTAMIAARKAQQLTPRAVAQAADLGVNTVLRFERGANVGFEAVLAMATVLGGELRFATDSPPTLTSLPRAEVLEGATAILSADTTPSFHVPSIGIMLSEAAGVAYQSLLARFEEPGRFVAVVESLATQIPPPKIGEALIVLAQRPELPSSRAIRALCSPES